MNSLVAEIIAGIEKHQEEAFLGATMVAEFATGHTHPVPPYDEKLKADPPSNADVQAMRKALLEYAQSGASKSYAALYVLSKFRDPSLVPLLRQQLAGELDALLEHNRGLSSLIIALDNCGERIISTGSQSPFEVDRSIMHARDYLKQFGQVFPH